MRINVKPLPPGVKGQPITEAIQSRIDEYAARKSVSKA